MKYDAFISYRHAPLDMEVAKKLHKTLETFHIPKSVQKKTGKKKISRVFRDQEELPIGSDLNDNISSALRESEYLIVICSKETPQSYWVLKEIETFIEMHDREHVLAILIDGEPWESFPAPLLTDDKGNPVEPLAADIRGTTPKEREKKFKSEFLRIAAPVIGCTYDDLKQRHKERIIKRNLIIGFSAAGVLLIFMSIFGIYNAVTAAKMKKLAEEKAALANEKTQLAGEILLELQAKQINQSRFYAQESAVLLKTGKREDAALVALAGLPNGEDDRPLVSEAEYALANALNAYSIGDRLTFDKTLTHQFNMKNTYMNEEQTRLTTVDMEGNVFVWDTDSMELLATIPVPETAENNTWYFVSANADASSVYVCYKDMVVKYDYNGKQLAKYTPDYKFSAADFHTGSGRAAFSGDNHLVVLELKDFSEYFVKDCELEDSNGYLSELSYSPKYDAICTEEGTINFANGETNVYFVDTITGDVNSTRIPTEYITGMAFTASGNFALLYANGMYRSDVEQTRHVALYSKDGKMLWSKDLACNLYIYHVAYDLLDTTTYTEDDAEHNIIVASTQYDTFTFDENTGELITSFSHPAPICSQYLGSTKNAFLLFLDGVISVVDLTTGQYYSDLEFRCNFTPDNLKVGKKGDELSLFVSESASPYVHGLSYTPSEGLKDFLDNPDRCAMVGIEPTGKYFSTFDFDTDIHYYYDSDGNLLYSDEVDYSQYDSIYLDGIHILPYGDRLAYIDPVNKTHEEIAYKDMIEEDEVSSYCYAHFINGQPFGAIFTTKKVFVVDLKERKIIQYFSYEEIINDALVSADGNILYLAFDDCLKIINTKTGEDLNKESLNLVPSRRNSGSATSMTFSPDGRYFAMYCADDTIRIMDTTNYSLKCELKEYASTSLSMFFSNDSSVFIYQGNSQVVYFYNLNKKEYINFLEASNTVRDAVFDEEDGLLALSDVGVSYLLSTSDYGLLSTVRNADGFLKDSNEFLVFMTDKVKKIKYMNYEELIAETKRQFPDAELTPQKKINYNID